MLNIFGEVLDVSGEGILIAEKSGKVQYVNERLLEFTNCEEDINLIDYSLEKALEKLFSSCGLSFELINSSIKTILDSNENGLEITRTDGEILNFIRKELSSEILLFIVKDITYFKKAEAKQKQILKVAIIALADLSEYRDQDTGDHVLRVARMTYEMARSLKKSSVYTDIITDDFLEHVGISSMLHDIGKVSISDSILLKSGPLTPEERTKMQRHTSDGSIILLKANRTIGDTAYFRLASEIAEFHHEFLDGNGYPNGLSGEKIPLSARIVAVSDVYDALTQKRVYKDPWPKDKVIAYINEKSGIQFDPFVVNAFMDVMKMRDKATFIEWTDEMSVGNPLMDHDHIILLTLVNQLMSEENRTDRVAVEFVLDELINYTITHFKKEEYLLKKLGYPDLEKHKKLHHFMTDRVMCMQKQLNFSFSLSFGDEVSKFLKNWLFNHILIEDKKYMNYFGFTRL